jgi:hypothetical protein
MRPHPSRGPLVEAATSLSVDRMTAEVVSAIEAAGLEAVLLKGPAIATRLYDPGEHRPYVDCDLLIPAASESLVAAVLKSLRFVPDPGLGTPDPGVAEQHAWHRGADHVDLHGSLNGIGAPPDQVWPVLTAGSEIQGVGGHEVRVLAPGPLALLLALHAASDGPWGTKALADLRRGVRLLDRGAWHLAADLAARLDALPALAAGLELLPEGRVKLGELGVEPPGDVMVRLRASGAAPLALSFERIRRERSSWARMRRILRGLFPGPTYMRKTTPLASHGPAGLTLAYLFRPLWLVVQLVPGLRSWNRARRQERRS